MSSEESRQAALRSGATLREIVTRTGRRAGVDLEPGCAYGAVTRAHVEDLTAELREIKTLINYLFTLVIGSIAIEVLLRLAGVG